MVDQLLRLQLAAREQLDHFGLFGIEILEGEAGAGNERDLRHLDAVPFEENGRFPFVEAADDDDLPAPPPIRVASGSVCGMVSPPEHSNTISAPRPSVIAKIAASGAPSSNGTTRSALSSCASARAWGTGSIDKTDTRDLGADLDHLDGEFMAHDAAAEMLVGFLPVPKIRAADARHADARLDPVSGGHRGFFHLFNREASFGGLQRGFHGAFTE
nr:hypothetical protein [Sphingomonas sp. NFR04]